MAAITGMGAVTPIGVGVPAFAASLRAGVSGTRLLKWTHHRVKARVAATCPDFDPRTVMTDADIARFPKLIPMALAAAREACAQAGLLGTTRLIDPTHQLLDTTQLDPTRVDPTRVAVILGTGAGGIDFTLDQVGALHHDRKMSLWSITNATHGNLAGELSIRLGAKGPSLCVSTGCASASDAVGLAKDLLSSPRPGAPDVVVVVGADAHVRWETVAGMELLGVIATRPCTTQAEAARASRPFCSTRDGFVLGEGAWAIVLERAPARLQVLNANRKPTRIIGHVRGYGATCDAFHRVRPEPDMRESTRAMQLALEDAAIAPEAVGVIHYHGTATAINDALETLAVKNALGAHAVKVRGHSVKSMIGHPQGASGLAAIVSTLAGLSGADGGKPFIFPTINLDSCDLACDLDYTPNHAANADASRDRFALINCLAFGAKNSALVLEVGDVNEPM